MTEVLKQVEQMSLKADVKLVFVKGDFDLRLERVIKNGEYVELAGYLGRHKVYRPVDESYVLDDLPF